MGSKINIKALWQKVIELFKGGFFHVFVGTFLNKAVTMISSIAVARFVDKDQYAYLNHSDSIYGYILLFSGLGLSSAILKVCSEDLGKGKDKGYVAYALKTGVAVQLLITVAAVGVIACIELPFPQAKHYIFITVLYPIMNYIYELALCYVRTKQENKFYAWLNFLYSVLTCVFSILLVLWLDAVGLIFARYLTVAVIGGIAFWRMRALLKGEKGISPTPNEKKALWSLSISLVIANAFVGMMPFNENMLIDFIIADEVISSNFKVANLFPQMIILISQAVNIYFFPIVANKYSRGESVKKYVLGVGLLNIGIVVLACLVGMFMTPFLIPMLYGRKYADAVGMSYLLWIMRGMNAGIRMVPTNMLIAIGKHKFNLFMSVAAFLLQLGLDYYFISEFGISGVAYGTIAVYLITGAVLWFCFFKNADKGLEQKQING